MVAPTPYHVEEEQDRFVITSAADDPIAVCSREAEARFLADLATVALHPALWSISPDAMPSVAMVWLQVAGQPISFEGPSIPEAVRKAAEHIRKGGVK